jgi:hypothetical protein
MKKNYGLLFVSYFIACSAFPLTGFTSNNPSLISVMSKSCLQCFGIMILFLLFFNLGLFIGHLAQSFYYLSKGYGMSPILLYPFLFIFTEKKKIRLFKNFLYMAEPFYPHKLFQNQETTYNEAEVSELCQQGHICALLAQISFYVICMVVFLLNLKIMFAISTGIMAMVFLSLAFTNTTKYQGLMIRNKFIKKGYAPIYLCRQLILYSSNNNSLYEKFEQLLGKNESDNFQKQILEVIQYMYMMKSINSEFEISETIDKYAEDNLFVHDIYEIYGIGAYKFDFMKVYLCYALIYDNNNKKKYVCNIMENLASQFGAYIKIKSLFYWYINIGRNYRIEEQKNSIFKRKILIPNGFYLKFDNYDNNYKTIIKKIVNICNVRR